MERVHSRRLINCDLESELTTTLGNKYGAEALYYTQESGGKYWKYDEVTEEFIEFDKDEIIFIAAQLLDKLDALISGTKDGTKYLRDDYTWDNPPGGGSGTDHFLGLYTSLANLQSAYPTAEDGDYATVDPGSGTDAVNYIWDEDEGWVAGGSPGGSGDVVGPSSAVSGAIVLYDGITGKLIKDSAKVLSTVGGNIAALTNPGAITFIRINADNTVTARTASQFLSDIGGVDTATMDAAIASAVAGLMDYRGVFDASVNAYPSSGGSGTAGAILKSDFWIVSVAGTLPTGLVVAPGDLVIAKVDTPGNTQANWSLVEYNIGFTPAPLDSPAFTGNPTAPNQSASDNSTKIATTAFVKAVVLEPDDIAQLAFNEINYNSY